MKAIRNSCAAVVVVFGLAACHGGEHGSPTQPSGDVSKIRNDAFEICRFNADIAVVTDLISKFTGMGVINVVPAIVDRICKTAPRERALQAARGLRAGTSEAIYGEIEGIPLRGRFDVDPRSN